MIFTAVVLFAFLAGKTYIVSGDGGTYIALSQSLHQGTYRAINVPGEPIQTQYPPLFPILLYPVAYQPSGSIGLVRCWVAAWSFLAVFAIARAASLRDKEIGVLAALPFLASCLYGEFGTSVLTECVFITICYAVVNRTQIWIESCKEIPDRKLDLLIPVGAGLAMLLKTAAVALVAAVFLMMLRHKKFRALCISVAILGMMLAPWWTWQNMHKSDYIQSHILMKDTYDRESEFLTPLEVLTYRVPHNASRYVGRITVDVLLPPYFRSIAPWTTYFWIKVGMSLILSIFCLYGFFRHCVKTKVTTEDLFAACMMGLLLLHPVFADRYMFFILPSMAGYLLFAFHNVVLRRKIAIVWSGIVLIGCVVSLGTPTSREDVSYIEAVNWLAENNTEQELVLARKPTTVWYYTGAQSRAYPVTANPDLWPGGSYYVIRDSFVVGVPAAQMYVEPVVTNEQKFEKTFTSSILDEVKVYRSK